MDGQPWVELMPAEAKQALDGDLRCTISRTDGEGGVNASLEVEPANEEVIHGGCTTTAAFSTAFARVVPGAPLEPNTSYRLSCGEEVEDEFVTGNYMALPPPTLVVEDVGIANYCNIKNLMSLDISGLDSAFWSEGGVILAEYEDGSVDWIGDAPVDGPARVVLELPAEGEETVVLTVVNGAGVAGPQLVVDVTSVAGPRQREGGCMIGQRSHSFFALWLSLFLLEGR